jgi:deazaflavin-dependent oxidoreductase (nitroreductase family)
MRAQARRQEGSMSQDKVVSTEIEIARRNWTAEHLRSYLQSGGTAGHIVDLRAIGGHAFTTTLLLRTVGRRSGEVRIAPLIYGDIGGEVVIVASKGGADVHPAWYVNLKSRPEVAFQIGSQAFAGSWRELQGVERDAIWAFMEKVYPPYTAYQRATQRTIPLVMLSPRNSIEVFRESE